LRLCVKKTKSSAHKHGYFHSHVSGGYGLLLNYCIDLNTLLQEKICNCLAVGLLAEFPAWGCFYK